jgi:hypothetical protein
MSDTSQIQTPVTIVQAWQAAANAADADTLLSLSDEQIEIIGPRGSAYGHDILRQWLARAGLTVEPKRVFARDNAVVVEQHGVWHNVDTGETMGEADLASSFRVTDGRVSRYARFETLDAALADVGLSESDVVS